MRVLEGALSTANALGPSQVLTDCGTVLFRDYGLHDHVRKQTNEQPNGRKEDGCAAAHSSRARRRTRRASAATQQCSRAPSRRQNKPSPQPTSAPGPGSPLPTSAPGPGSPHSSIGKEWTPVRREEGYCGNGNESDTGATQPDMIWSAPKQRRHSRTLRGVRRLLHDAWCMLDVARCMV